MAGIKKELWTKRLVEKFEEKSGFLDEFTNEDKNVNNDVIHLTDIGADPAVLINNTTYPIPVATSTDTDIPVQLDRYDTQNTEIPEADIETLSYDVIDSHNRRHIRSLNETSLKKAAHSIAPPDNTVSTIPLLQTTGANDGAGFKSCTQNDILKMKEFFDTQNVPLDERVLVLCPKHVTQLALDDKVFADELRKSGVAPINYYGFRVYQFGSTAYYTDLYVKVAYGAVLPPSARYSSVAFAKERVFKAKGTAKAYMSKAEDNPTTRKTTIGYGLRYVAMRVKNEGVCSLVAASV